MANKALRGLTIEIGGDTTELNKALDTVDKRTRSLSSELRDIDKALKLDPTNTELVAQKQKVLADAISSTEERLGLLKEAEKQAQKQFERGEITQEQYRALRREVIATEGKIQKLTSQAEELADANRDVARSAGSAADELNEQADKSEKAKESAEELDDASNDLAKGGLAALATAAAAAVTAIVALAESSREYRTEMAKLDTAFTDVGFSAEAATETYEALQSVVGETDQAVEAANLLAKLCTTEEELADWTEILTGVYGTFGSSLSIESLAEAANETARVGTVTGSLADSLNWAAAEGETFGVKLKENIEFTELSSKKLKRLSESQKAEYEARKAQYEEIEAYNKKVMEAASAEDYFNIALEECSTAQERQQLITKTLTNLYGGAATQYKATNKEVIRANEATEKWNKATAKIGKTVEPMVTDFKELGVALLDDVSEPLEKIAAYIRGTVIPTIKKVSTCVKQNTPTIKASIVAVTTAMVALKAATVANTVAQKGLTGAIKATTVAQKALNLVQKATPTGLLVAGLTAVTTAVVAYTVATENAKTPVEELTEEEKELISAAQEAAEAFREQQKATEQALREITTEMDGIQKLADELGTLADASGKVRDEDKKRAEYILNELNEALGTEYKMTGNIIDNYKELKTSIDNVIQSKTANALLDAGLADYTSAVTNETAAWNERNRALEAYNNQVTTANELQKKADEAWKTYVEMAKIVDETQADGYYKAWELAEKDAEKAQEQVNLKKATYDEAEKNYNNYRTTIEQYTAAQEAAIEGEYQTTIDIFSRKDEIYAGHTETVDEETAKVLATLEKAAMDAYIAAKTEKENFEKGIAGFTEKSVKEAEEGYQEALGKWASAYSDAYGLGEDFGQGVADGIKIKNGAVGAAAIAQIREAVKAAKKEAEINSPSKKTMAIGEGLGEGEEVGIQNKTKDVKKAAQQQMETVLDVYGSPEHNAQKVYRNIAEQQSARQLSGQQALASANGPMLERILSAIEKGQVIALDGDAIVGATADRMDSALGRRRTLASRGAI